MTPLQTKRQIEIAQEMAERNGFLLQIFDDIRVIANRKPYVQGTWVVTLPTFDAVIFYFEGYEQMKLERQELDRK
jgi:hypothetical protein